MEEQIALNAHGWGAKYAPAPTPELGAASCTDAIIALGGEFMKVVDDVKSVIGGDIMAVMTLVNDVKSFIADVKAAASVCGLGEIYGFSGACQDDINTVVATI